MAGPPTRLERIVSYVRRLRSSEDGALELNPSLPDADLRRLRRIVDDSINARGGEVAARRTARAVGTTFSTLDDEGRHRFFRLLAQHYDGDDAAVDRAIDAVRGASDTAARRTAEHELRAALEPPRERLFRRFAGLDGGLPFLIGLREDLMGRVRGDPELADLDADLRSLLETWFDVALLRLERLTWNSPAALLERLIEYEAVHAIESWDDLKSRLTPGRRCYAFLHPAMPDDPLIFVEVALTTGIATSLPNVLDPSAARPAPDEADTAIFYSISNCHRGLAGVSLGDFLIKSVAEHLTEDLPNIKRFATLSPLPGFRRWLASGLDDTTIRLTAADAAQLGEPDPVTATTALAASIARPVPATVDELAHAGPVLMRLAADYLVNQRRGHRALDPVAHFHLSNGASIEQLNWWANPRAAGWERGLGIMVNYRYRLRDIERNHDAYVERSEITAAEGVRRLLNEARPTDDD
ncbi:MAG: malonyl-CoA decarboxylase family protein [Actinomycetota bacterium]